ncbi:MAG TPA: proton-conducting transporter membrane subunit, partial [Candidatus Omnitrophota bacterium]|nr:proton-conducting transporter membrane subunit [Candidatus Omnitrophota bacterium]
FASFLSFNLTADNLSKVLLLCIGIVVAVSLVVSRYLIKDSERGFYFANLILLELMGLNGVVLVRDVFSMYVFWEVAAAASFILISLEKEKEALEGAFKYLIFSAVATVFVLSSIALILLISGGTSFDVIKTALASSSHSFLIILAVAMFLAGLFMKAGAMPFHGYLPDAYTAAPSCVSVLLAGIVTKTLGVYTIMRIVTDIFGFSASIQSILMFTGVFSIVFGAVCALGQKDLKRLLSYSSISQLGYIFLGFGCGTALGIAASIFHLFNHTIFKSLLFVNAAAVEDSCGTRDMDKTGGLGKKMPLTAATSVLASLSTAGIPPLAGFWSKLLIVIALWQCGHFGYAVVAIMASLLTLAYMLLMQRKVFFGQLNEDLSNVLEAGFGLILPSIVLSAIMIVVGVLFPFFVNTLILPVNSLY